MYSTGRTAEILAYDRYFAADGVVMLPSDGTVRWLQPEEA